MVWLIDLKCSHCAAIVALLQHGHEVPLSFYTYTVAKSMALMHNNTNIGWHLKRYSPEFIKLLKARCVPQGELHGGEPHVHVGHQGVKHRGVVLSMDLAGGVPLEEVGLAAL